MSRARLKGCRVVQRLCAPLLVLLIANCGGVLANGIKVRCTPSRDSVYLGESFNLTVEVEGADKSLGEPDLSELPPADVQFLGQHSNSRSSISIVNGRMTRTSFEGRVYSYQIKPRAEGSFRAGPVHITFGGRRYSASGGNVRVKGVEHQDTVMAAVGSSSTSVLVEQPFAITISVAVAELPEPYAAENEPLLPSLPPRISADFLDIRHETKGLKGPDLNQTLNNLIDQSGSQPAFAINDYMTRDMSSGFGRLFGDDPFRQRPIRFRLAPERIEVNGRSYRSYSLSLDYTPTQEGEYTFGPLSFKGQVIDSVDANRRPIMKDIYTIGPAVTVRVVPPPDEGRPEWFVGTVGRDLKATALFDATVCKVGDPLTLTLEVTGAISTSNLRTPLLGLQPELGRDFRVYDDNVSSETLENGKRFKYRVRPTREGTLEFPPIKIAYYDTEAQGYRTVTTAPAPIQARATTQIAALEDDEVSALTGELTSQTRPQPPGITLDAAGARDDPLLPPGRLVIPLLLGGPLLCLLALLLRPLARLLQSLRAQRRRAGAGPRARARLARAKTPEAAISSIRTYLVERFDAAGTTLTPSEVVALLQANGIDQDDARELGTLLASLEEALYRPDTTAPVDTLIARLRKWFSNINPAY